MNEKKEERSFQQEPVYQEIIIKFKEDRSQDDVINFFGARRAEWKELPEARQAEWKEPPVEVRPSFDEDPQILDAIQRNATSRLDRDVPSLSKFYRVRLTEPLSDEEIDDLVSRIVADNDEVEYAARAALPGPPPAPSFENDQLYLDQPTGNPSLGGVGARCGWEEWNGDGVRVCDCEYGFRITHKDLTDENDVSVVDVISNRDGNLEVEQEHGTCTLGVLAGQDNGEGVKGICYGATILFASESGGHRLDCLNDVLVAVGFLFSVGLEYQSDLEAGQLSPEFQKAFSDHGITLSDDLSIEPHSDGDKWHIIEESDARRTFVVVREDEALDIYARGGGKLKPGDVVLLEMQTLSQLPAEYDGDVHAVVTTLVGLDIVVVAAAGNAGVDLGSRSVPRDEERLIWREGQPEYDSGAILVGAGHPHINAPHIPHAKIQHSNFGSRVDCQGWGHRVVTAGKGDLYNADGPDHYYTNTFDGTSSATAIVAGVVACLQSYADKSPGGRLPPHEIRELLRSDANGSPQGDEPSNSKEEHPIGPLPDLCRLIEAA